MRLTDPWFAAAFIGRINPATLDYYSNFAGRLPEHAIPFAEAQALILWCPCGYGNPRYPIDGGRPHAIIVSFRDRGVPDNYGPVGRDKKTRPRWGVSGTSLDDLVITPSVNAGEPSCWHGHIGLRVPGDITTC